MVESTDRKGWSEAMPKILVIDDKPDNLISVSALLKQLIPDCRVVTADSGRRGIEMVKAEHPDTILLDIRMPEIDGFEVCRQIRSDPDICHIPIIMLTAVATDGVSKIRGLETGADAFMTKPVDEAEMAAQVKAALRIKRAEDRLRMEKIRLEDEIAERTRSLRESEERFRTIIENAPFGYFRVSPKGEYQYVNHAWERMYGYHADEIIGKSYALTQPEKSLQQADKNMRRVLRGESVEGESARLKKDGSVEYHMFNVKPVYENGQIVAVEGFLNDLTERKQAEEYIHLLSQQLLKAHENERQMISRELHDRIGQDLSSIKIGCDTLFDAYPQPTETLRQKVTGFSKLLQSTIMAVRDLAYELRPPLLDQLGLLQAVFEHCEDFSEKNNLDIDLSSAGMDDLHLHPDVEINVYRLIQEALNNVNKHARAKRVNIRILAVSPDIVIRIEDDGRGFDLSGRVYHSGRKKWMGLRSMEERVKLLGGRMNIQSKPGSGTKILIQFPYMESKK